MSLPYHKPPPYERPNWDRLNEGQRRYAMEQYNLALVRRGQHFSPPQVDNPSNEPNAEVNPHLLEAINNLERDLAGRQEESNRPDSPVAGPSRPDTSVPAVQQVHTPTMADIQAAAGAKRPADSTVEAVTGAKRGKTTGHSPSALPGTSGNTDGMVGGAGGSSEAGTGAAVIPRGINTPSFTWTFKKKWKFLTFGVADNIINETLTSGTTPLKRWALTTSLANIPWEYAFFYMSPAEYARIREMKGVFANHASIKIFQFNPRVAFQTADTNSTQATLNQNKFTRIAIGLRGNACLYGSDRDYVFDTDEPMKPTGFETSNDRTGIGFRNKLAENFYGSDNTQTANVPTIPALSTGRELGLLRYYTVYASQTVDCGFPMYNQFCEEYNSMDMLGKEVVNMDYNFTYAPIIPRADNTLDPVLLQGDSLTTLPASLGADFEVTEGHVLNNLMATTDQKSGGSVDRLSFDKYTGHLSKSGVSNNPNLRRNVFDTPEYMYTHFPMEQAGAYHECNMAFERQRSMPSIHVGVRPVPKLGTAANAIAPDSWLDCQMYWTVEASLTLTTNEPFVYPRGNTFDTYAKTQLAILETNKVKPQLHSYDRPFVIGRPQLVEFDQGL